MDDAVAMRGMTRMTASELEAHLALALRTENVGALLGAGCSVPAGGPTIRKIWEQLTASHSATADWLASEHYADLPEDGSPPNLEEIIDRLAIAEQDLQRRGADSTAEYADILRHRRVLYRLLLSGCLLREGFWDGTLDPATDEVLHAHRTLLARLISTRSPGQDAPWIFTTNYDLALEWSAESLSLEVINGFGGLHDRRFSSSRFDLGFRNVQASGLARLGSYHMYLIKLHGSMTWLRSQAVGIREVSAIHAWRDIQPALSDDSEDDLKDLVLILPNAQKYLATAGFIYGELIRRFTEFLGRPQTTLLVAGFSFNDEHLNRVIRSALNNPTLHLIVFLPELEGDDAKRFESLSVTARGVVEPLIMSASPRVTFVHGETAFFDRLIELLPEPALLDDTASQGLAIEKVLSRTRPVEEVPRDATD